LKDCFERLYSKLVFKAAWIVFAPRQANRVMFDIFIADTKIDPNHG
jgi:hypothetical protein